MIEFKQGIQRLWCQHCKALQKSSGIEVDCWYNPLSEAGESAFCAANEDATNAMLKSLVEWLKQYHPEKCLLVDRHNKPSPALEFVIPKKDLKEIEAK